MKLHHLYSFLFIGLFSMISLLNAAPERSLKFAWENDPYIVEKLTQEFPEPMVLITKLYNQKILTQEEITFLEEWKQNALRYLKDNSSKIHEDYSKSLISINSLIDIGLNKNETSEVRNALFELAKFVGKELLIFYGIWLLVGTIDIGSFIHNNDWKYAHNKGYRTLHRLPNGNEFPLGLAPVQNIRVLEEKEIDKKLIYQFLYNVIMLKGATPIRVLPLSFLKGDEQKFIYKDEDKSEIASYQLVERRSHLLSNLFRAVVIYFYYRTGSFAYALKQSKKIFKEFNNAITPERVEAFGQSWANTAYGHALRTF